jgi:hypothetical protein
MKNLSSHTCKRHFIHLSRSEILKWVEVSTNPLQHWEWNTSAPERRFNRYGQAIWVVKILKYLPRQQLVVARLLLDDFRGPFPHRTMFRCQCEFAGCVNPYHWEPIARPAAVRLARVEFGWVPVHARTGKPLTRNVPLVVTAADATTHVVLAGTTPTTRYQALCGLEVYPINMIVHHANTQVTCKGGCT